ncbi:hypothetical protein SCHPADRAFT_1001799 [Schizopora paradoxa]|uniref:F-box domain-containing protein n=1 Tax=Schizopora paradoxa TaxID=27342 RepID=A0A0H2R5Z1_9AGAM|nr:hypothetical protein SCHPADRAFT_1001799 [Schizopora paradoxa]
MNGRREEYTYISLPLSIRLRKEHFDFLSSWRMPKLTHLELSNFIPYERLCCENVTRLSIRLTAIREQLDVQDLRVLFESMPRIQSLSITFGVDEPFDLVVRDGVRYDNDGPALPNLAHLNLEVEAMTPDDTINHFVALLNLQSLTHLSLSFFWDDRNCMEPAFEKWIGALTPCQYPMDKMPPTFARLEIFSLKTDGVRGSHRLFKQIFMSMPNVHVVSLNITYDADIFIDKEWVEGGALSQLRTLRIEVLQISPSSSPLSPRCLDALYKMKDCEQFKTLEFRISLHRNLRIEKKELQSLMRDKL